MLRRIILNLHMYGGLLASGYFILLGVSSLQFNHHFFPDEAPGVTWQRDGNPLCVAGETLSPEAVRDGVGLMGWVNKPSIRRGATGELKFQLDRPGRNYSITASSDGSHVQVMDRRSSWNIIGELHGLSGVPGSRLLAAWGVYTEFATAFGVFAIASGVYLFTSTRRDRRMALTVFLITAAASGIAMFSMIYRG